MPQKNTPAKRSRSHGTRGRGVKVTPHRDTFAAVLVKARIAKGLSRAEMARRYGAAPTVITRLESGRSCLNEATVRRYARALGLKPRLVLNQR